MKKKLLLLLTVSCFIAVYAAHNVFAERINVSSEKQKVSVSASNLSQPTLGVAFHLEYQPNWQYESYQLGPFFQKNLHQTNQEAIVLVNNNSQKHELIVGVSLRRNEILPKGSGEIISFNFLDTQTEAQLSNKTTPAIKITNTSIRQLFGQKIAEKRVKWLQKN